MTSSCSVITALAQNAQTYNFYFYQKKFDLTDILEQIYQTLPQGTYLTRFTFSPLTQTQKEKYLAQISLSGFCPNRETLIKLKENIEGVEIFSEVSFPASNWIESTDINFSVTFKLE